MLIGIPISESKTQYFINQAYLNYIHSAGLEAVLINPKSDLEIMTNICDGLLLPGGIDIDPIFYEEENYSSYSVDPEKDAFERATLHAFIARSKPIFGICRGLQLIAWELMLHLNTGTALCFTQHIECHSLANDLSLSRNVRSHSIMANANVLYNRQGRDNRNVKLFVNSMHHQCLLYDTGKGVDHGDLAEINFQILATTKNGVGKLGKSYSSYAVIEAFKMNWAGSRILAVQWHPEELEDNHLLSNFFVVQDRAERQIEGQNVAN
jgi:gamma-glutamyl-gamma-aminobutyrate hydrolase PuuD